MSPKKSDRAEWGSLTRKGAAYVEGKQEPSRYMRPEKPSKPGIDDRIRDEAKEAIDRGRDQRPRSSQAIKRTKLPSVPLALDDPEMRLAKALGKKNAAKAIRELERASLLFADERFPEARKILKPLADDAPDVAEVRELFGVTLYRLGKWRDATAQLEAFRDLAGTTEQHPVLADCYRALERWDDVDELWEELKQASPSADLVTEGRVVVAGSLADRGDLSGAITLLEKGWKAPKRARDHHLRRAYALADLYERSGRTARARELFRWVQKQSADFADIGRRVGSLS